MTYDTFGLTAETADFHAVLDRLIDAYDSVEEIDQFFSPALSGQAMAYVMAGIAKKEKKS